MNIENKIDAILRFVNSYPDSIASRAILRRHFPGSHYFEMSEELSGELKEILKKDEQDEIDFCYYLVK